ncbi:MAG: hypothetical protein GY719_25365 [bacterium]|nr:hypothetical protein [bacterium]
MIDLSPVVVTGLGTVHAVGCGRRRMAAALRRSTTCWTEVDRSAGYHRREGSRLAALTAGLDLSPWLSRVAARRMSLPSKLAVAAARMALEDAGLETGEEDDESPTAVVVSNPHGPTALLEGILGQYYGEGPLAVSPALFTESVANAPAAQVAIACHARGPNLTVIQREAGALIALAQGAAEIVLGRAGRALVVVVDELTPLLHSIFDRFGGLALAGDDGREAARPFDRRRDGCMAAEGACSLVLEPEETVRERGARALARLRSSADAFDPRAPRSGWSRSPDLLAPALERYLSRTGLEPGDLDTIVSGASGSFAGDRLEARVLKSVWGERALPPILAPKAVTGEHGGGLLAALVLAAAGEPFGPTPGFSEVDPKLGITPHDGGPLGRPSTLLATSLAAGGAAAWLVVEAGEGA